MSRFRKGRVQISPGFCLLTGWFLLVNGWELLAIVLSAAALHELGHLLVLRLCGAEIQRLRINLFGAALETSGSRLSYGAELAALLAGPAANLLCAAILAALDGERWATVIGAQLILGGFNLLPLRPLDGGRALETLVSWVRGPIAGERAARLVGGSAALALFWGTVQLVRLSGGNLWLLPPALAMLFIAAAELTGTGASLAQR